MVRVRKEKQEVSRAGKRVLCKHVAEHAGVTPGTVSVVLNDRPGARVSDATRQRIREAGDWRAWVPPAVAAYIDSQGLYRDPGAILAASSPSARD